MTAAEGHLAHRQLVAHLTQSGALSADWHQRREHDMTNILERVRAYKGDEIAAAKRSQPPTSLESEVRDAATPRGFLAAIERRLAAGEYALIAEIKKASPSKGLIRADFDPPALARSYEAGGATCLALVEDPMARELEDATLSYGMDVLVEAHNEEELDRAASLRSRLIGINNRDLLTFETTLATSERLAPLVPSERVVVGESGITAPADLARLAGVGISAFLVGESLMRQPDVASATSALIGHHHGRPQ
jgi:indole-3-glycerol phosphate synthase